MSLSTFNSGSPRLASLDAFRGFVILTMVFVNHLAGIRDVPGWMRHMPEGAEGMTFVDVVFPAFLFIVGMAIPPALDRRRERGRRSRGRSGTSPCAAAGSSSSACSWSTRTIYRRRNRGWVGRCGRFCCLSA